MPALDTRPNHHSSPTGRRGPARLVGAIAVIAVSFGFLAGAAADNLHVVLIDLTAAICVIAASWIMVRVMERRMRDRIDRMLPERSVHGIDPEVIAAARRISHRLTSQDRG